MARSSIIGLLFTTSLALLAPLGAAQAQQLLDALPPAGGVN